jgi:hypothetical protein
MGAVTQRAWADGDCHQDRGREGPTSRERGRCDIESASTGVFNRYDRERGYGSTDVESMGGRIMLSTGSGATRASPQGLCGNIHVSIFSPPPIRAHSPAVRPTHVTRKTDTQAVERLLGRTATSSGDERVRSGRWENAVSLRTARGAHSAIARRGENSAKSELAPTDPEVTGAAGGGRWHGVLRAARTQRVSAHASTSLGTDFLTSDLHLLRQIQDFPVRIYPKCVEHSAEGTCLEYFFFNARYTSGRNRPFICIGAASECRHHRPHRRPGAVGVRTSDTHKYIIY